MLAVVIADLTTKIETLNKVSEGLNKLGLNLSVNEAQLMYILNDMIKDITRISESLNNK